MPSDIERRDRMKLTTIKLRRLERGQLQIETARRARISRSRLSEIENAHVMPRDDELQRLARTLGVAPESLRSATASETLTT